MHLNVRFVFLTRTDLTGSFDQNNQDDMDFLAAVEAGMQQRWANVTDNDNCLPNNNYPKDANIRVKLEMDWIIAPDAWDYTVQASQLPGYNWTSFCPGDVLVSTNSTFPQLNQIISTYNQSYPNSFNLFFVEDGEHIAALENYLSTNTSPTGPITGQYSIFGGCSRLAAAYNSQRDQSIIMANWYTGYLSRREFGGIYYGNGTPNSTYVEWLRNDFSITANHEIGHSVLNQSHTNTCDNLMQGAYDPGKRFLEPNQLDKLVGTIMSSNNHKFVDCSMLNSATCKVEITNDLIIDDPISVFGDLVVSEGVTLTLTSDVYLAKESTIDVKEGARLILDGALLTNDCDPTWKGIRVAGGNSDFDVKIINSTIENTSQAAIDTEAWWYGNPNGATFVNGIVHIENSVFNNTSRMLHLSNTTVAVNDSYIKNSVQNGGTYGITNYQNIFVEVEDNTFNDIANSCIVGIRGQFAISNNEFYADKNDVLLETSAAGFGSTIISNVFYGNDAGIRCVGTTFGAHVIEGNNFNNISYPVWMDGDNHYTISNNTINSIFGGIFISTGSSGNEVFGNKFNSSYLGLYVGGENDDYNFYLNCFNSGYGDVYIPSDGIVGQIIANPSLTSNRAANNCFSHQGVSSSNIYDINGDPTPFVYVEPNDEVINCSDLLYAPNTVSITNSGDHLDPCTESYVQDSILYPRRNMQSLLFSKGWLENKIGEINSSQSSGFAKVYENRLESIKGQLSELYLESRDLSSFLGLYNPSSNWSHWIKVCGAYYFMNDYTALKQMLRSVPSSAPVEIQDFAYIQSILISEVLGGSSFQPSVNQLDSLLEIADKGHSCAAYAKAQYYSLTGNTIYSTLQFSNEGLPLSPLATPYKEIMQPRIYPNPFHNLITVEVPKELERSDFRVLNVHGQQLMSGEISASKVILDANNWGRGVFFFLIEREGEILFQNKITSL